MKLIEAPRTLVAIVIGVLALFLVIALLVYPSDYVYRAVVWQESDAFDWQKFPAHPLNAAPTAYHFDTAPDPRVEELSDHHR